MGVIGFWRGPAGSGNGGGGDWADVTLATGAPGSAVAYDAGSNTLSIPRGADGDDAALPVGVAGQLVGYGVGGVPLAVDPPSFVSVAWTDVTGKPATYPPSTHSHGLADVTGLQAALDGKAASSAIPTTEQLQDLVAAMFQSGTHTNASISYDDTAGTLSITASGGGGGLTQEQVEDMVGALVQVQGAGISVVYDDAGNALRIGLSGESFTTALKNKLDAIAAGATANASNAELRDRSTHTGEQAISTVTGLQAALDTRPTASAAVLSTSIRNIVSLSQSAYDALATKDGATLYAVI